MSEVDVAVLKDVMRLEARARRAKSAKTIDPNSVIAHALEVVPAGEIVAGFFSMGSEIDTAPLLAAFKARGTALCLPFIQEADPPLGFRAYRPGDVLIAGPLGTREPVPDAALMTPSVLLVPLLSFDPKGWRLGYGGGYYDRTLRGLRAGGGVTAIGLAFAFQEVESVPHDDRDEKLDMVVTERGVLSFAEV